MSVKLRKIKGWAVDTKHGTKHFMEDEVFGSSKAARKEAEVANETLLGGQGKVVRMLGHGYTVTK